MQFQTILYLEQATNNLTEKKAFFQNSRLTEVLPSFNMRFPHIKIFIHIARSPETRTLESRKERQYWKWLSGEGQAQRPRLPCSECSREAPTALLAAGPLCLTSLTGQGSNCPAAMCCYGPLEPSKISNLSWDLQLNCL